MWGSIASLFYVGALDITDRMEYRILYWRASTYCGILLLWDLCRRYNLSWYSIPTFIVINNNSCHGVSWYIVYWWVGSVIWYVGTWYHRYSSYHVPQVLFSDGHQQSVVWERDYVTVCVRMRTQKMASFETDSSCSVLWMAYHGHSKPTACYGHDMQLYNLALVICTGSDSVMPPLSCASLHNSKLCLPSFVSTTSYMVLLLWCFLLNITACTVA